MSDASRRVERIDVREQFAVSPTWRLLSLCSGDCPGGAGDAAQRGDEESRSDAEPPAEIKKQIKTATQKLQEKVSQTQKRAEELGLKDNDTLKEINKELDKLARQRYGRPQGRALKAQRSGQGDREAEARPGRAEKIRKELDKLKDIAKGPADKMAAALKEGDFGKARKR